MQQRQRHESKRSGMVMNPKHLEISQLEWKAAERLREMLHGTADPPEDELLGDEHNELGELRSRARQVSGNGVSKRQPPGSIFADEPRHALVRTFLLFSGLLCNLDLFAVGLRPAELELAENNTGKFRAGKSKWIQVALFGGFIKVRLLTRKLVRKSAWFKANRNRLWPRLVLCLFLASVGHLAYYLYHQYAYDYYRFRLMRVRWFNRTHPQELIWRQLKREDALLEDVRLQGDRVRSIGGPIMHLGFLVQSFYFVPLVYALISYLLPRLYFKLCSPFDFYFIRNFLDYTGEQENTRHLINEQARRFLESSRSYTRALVEFSKRSVGERLLFERYASMLREQQLQQRPHLRVGDVPRIRLNEVDKGEGLRRRTSETSTRDSAQNNDKFKFTIEQLDRLIYSESLSCKQLRGMLERHELRPMNQSVGWVRRQLRRYSAVCLLCACCTSLNYFFMGYLMVAFVEPTRVLQRNDLPVTLEVFALVTICNVTFLFYTASLVATCMDQIQLTNRLRSLIELVISLNNLRFSKSILMKMEANRMRDRHRESVTSLRERAASRASLERQQLARPDILFSQRELLHSHAAYENEMNNDFLLAFMHYKIFVAQLLQAKQALRAIAFAVVVFAFLYPIVFRVHMPYIEPNLIGVARRVIVLTSGTVFFLADINLVPICYLHKRCLDLYELLNRLTAHATEIISHPEGRDVYDRHIISMLRKELRYTDQMGAQFVLKINGFKFTYPNLVKLHFYFSFIILSILSEEQASQHEVAGTIFNDPLGLF